MAMMKPTPPPLLTLDRVHGLVIDTVAVQLDQDFRRISAEDLFSDLGADSLDEVELMMAFEDEFRIDINDEAFASVHTIGDAAQYIFDQIVALQ